MTEEEIDRVAARHALAAREAICTIAYNVAGGLVSNMEPAIETIIALHVEDAIRDTIKECRS